MVRKGKFFYYDQLVLATGARSHLPQIPGVTKSGVYTFRSLQDAELLFARTARTRSLVVAGGGLLGIEAAKALTRNNTHVTLVHQGPHLMNRQLDGDTANYVLRKLTSLGINVELGTRVREVLGECRVEGILTNERDLITCDTVLLCTGINPNVTLARQARLKVSRGILVDDHLQTSDENIYAIGECCEHRGSTFGLVNPGYEQAAVLADVICKGQASYKGSVLQSRLKVLGVNVSSLGKPADTINAPRLKEIQFVDNQSNRFRKILLSRNRLVSAAAYGDWDELRQLQEAYQTKRPISLWAQWRFKTFGNLFPVTQKNP